MKSDPKNLLELLNRFDVALAALQEEEKEILEEERSAPRPNEAGGTPALPTPEKNPTIDI